MERTQSIQKAIDFEKLHSNFFILPNAWDAASAKIFEQCGFKALGTTSAGIAASYGYADRSMPFDTMLDAVRNIVHAVDIPVTVDIEDGYGETPEDAAEAVKKVITAGAVGINLEDSTMDPQKPLQDISFQQKKIDAIRELGERLGIPVFINARTDPYWIKLETPFNKLDETIKRAHAYQEAGADCIFVPGIKTLTDIRTLRQEINAPINVLAAPGLPSAHELEALGIQRISTGSGPYRAVLSFLQSIGQEMLERGIFEPVTSTSKITYDDLLRL
ncbi:dihydrouridine synthase [Paenibacillus ihbetae]|uniref:Dihydrouridine synthase n=1 Tax=Paenibacillus ihbetae TaxID=1870820 RepID=A0A1B2E7Z3_9BACL|nr:isocitrate lyase/phosphoenolpyruvate mutase family protein [Paenibacillus ihbetae]ANY76103.1 dihydrouridine synthase [Paenibacillus ihbetae]